MSGAEAEHQRLLQHPVMISVHDGNAALRSGKWTADQPSVRNLNPLTQILRAFDALHQQKGLELRHRIDSRVEQEADPDDPRAADDIVVATEKGGVDALGPRPAHRSTYIGAQGRRC